MAWLMSLKISLRLLLALGVVILLLWLAVERARPPIDGRRPYAPPPEHLTFSWQFDHCPAEARSSLEEIRLPGDRVADVEILELEGGRIYLPRAWTTTTRHAHGPSPDGVSARSGGSGTFEPWRGPGADGLCRGIVYRSIAGESGDDPRFTLKLYFQRSPTRSPEGGFRPSKAQFPSAHEGLEFFFFAPDDDPDRRPLLDFAAVSDPGEELGDGWRVVERSTRQALKRLAFDSRASARGEPAARAVEVLEGWALVFPLHERVRAMIVVDRGIPAERWRNYGREAAHLYRWLRTKPGDRGAPPSSF
jgi:hypothetical protein